MSELGSGKGTSYPGALDTDNTLEVNSPNAGKTKARAEVPNDLAAAVIAIETALGIDPAGTLTDVKTFLQTEHQTDGTHGAITPTSIVCSGAASFGSVSASAGMNNNNGIMGAALTATVGSKALTVALKTLDGGNPASDDPVIIQFRSATATDGVPVNRSVTEATSVVLSSGSTLGFTSALAGRIYVWAIDNAGTVVLGLSRYANMFGEHVLVSTTAEGGAGGADSTTVMYSTAAQTNKAVRCLGFIDITTGAVAGEWDNAPTRVQMMGPGVNRTGDIVQTVMTQYGATDSTTTVLPADNTVPQLTEGKTFMSQAITPTSAINTLYIEAIASVSTTVTGNRSAVIALFQDSTADSLAATANGGDVTNHTLSLKYTMTAGTASSTTFKINCGANTTGTCTFNPTIFGGTIPQSYIMVTEVFA